MLLLVRVVGGIAGICVSDIDWAAEFLGAGKPGGANGWLAIAPVGGTVGAVLGAKVGIAVDEGGKPEDGRVGGACVQSGLGARITSAPLF